MYEDKLKEAKKSYYNNIVEDLKESDVGKWYSKLKRMSCDEKAKNEAVYVENLVNFPMDIQAEKIADAFAKISNEYEPLEEKDVDISEASNEKPFPYITSFKIHKKIKKMKNKTSTVFGDIPWKIVKNNCQT